MANQSGTPLGRAGNINANVAASMRAKAPQPPKKVTKTTTNLPNQGKSSLSVIPNHRYRRYFGIRAPGSGVF